MPAAGAAESGPTSCGEGLRLGEMTRGACRLPPDLSSGNAMGHVHAYLFLAHLYIGLVACRHGRWRRMTACSTTAGGERRRPARRWSTAQAGARSLRAAGIERLAHRAVAGRAGAPLSATTCSCADRDDLLHAAIECATGVPLRWLRSRRATDAGGGPRRRGLRPRARRRPARRHPRRNRRRRTPHQRRHPAARIARRDEPWPGTRHHHRQRQRLASGARQPRRPS